MSALLAGAECRDDLAGGCVKRVPGVPVECPDRLEHLEQNRLMSGGCNGQMEVQAALCVLSVAGPGALLDGGPNSFQIRGRRPLRGERRKPDLEQEYASR